MVALARLIKPIPIRSLLRSAIGLGCAQWLLGCRTDLPMTPASNVPFVFVVLTSSHIAIGGGPEPDSSIIGLLLTVGTPFASPFRTAERFEMRRSSDGAFFGWAARTPSSAMAPVDLRGISVSEGNYVLERAGTAAGLGADSIAPLDSYTLTIDTQGSLVTGRTTVPGLPQPRLVIDGTRRFVVFPRVAGAAGYIEDADTEREVFGPFLSTDTVLELRFARQPIPPNPEFRVIALDTNAFRYLSDTTRASAGLVGALGLFGAASKSVPLPLPNQ
jgi:hypothetical protein